MARIGGRRLTFEEEGIYNGVFVMRDRETGTLWSHYTGEAFEGPLLGNTLEWVQTERTRFDRLTEELPEATIPERKAMRFRGTPPVSGRQEAIGQFLPPGFGGTIEETDDRLGRHEHGLGVFVGGAHRFVPLDALNQHRAISDKVGDVPIIVTINDRGEAAAAWSRCFEGSTLTLAPATFEGRTALVDKETGTTWVAGEGVDGPGKGQRLTPVRSIVTDWYGWVAYFPKTTIYGVD